MAERTPPTSDVVFALGLRAGEATALELARTYGWDSAAAVISRDVWASLSDDEMGILGAAVRLILAQRETAPDDLSTLPHVPAVSCPDLSCRICHHTKEGLTP